MKASYQAIQLPNSTLILLFLFLLHSFAPDFDRSSLFSPRNLFLPRGKAKVKVPVHGKIMMFAVEFSIEWFI